MSSLSHIFAASCLLLSAFEVIVWALGYPSDLASAIVGSSIAVLFPFVDRLGRSLDTRVHLKPFVYGSILLFVPIFAITVIHQTLPMLVIATVFVTAALYHYPGRGRVERYLLAVAFLMVWGLAGQAAVGKDWMRMDHLQLALLFAYVPAAAVTTISSERIK